MRSKSSGRSFDSRRDGARRTKDDRLGIQRGRKCIVQGSRASHEYDRQGQQHDRNGETEWTQCTVTQSIFASKCQNDQVSL